MFNKICLALLVLLSLANFLLQLIHIKGFL